MTLSLTCKLLYTFRNTALNRGILKVDGTEKWGGTFGQERTPSAVSSLTWSPDGLLLAAGSESGVVRLWDIRTGQVLSAFRGESSDYVDSLTWAPDGSFLASSALFSDTVQVWDPQQMKLLRPLKKRWAELSHVCSLAWSPDSVLLAVGKTANVGEVQLWNVQKGWLVETLEGHSWAVTGLRWSHDGLFLASCDQSSIIVWKPSEHIKHTFGVQAKTVVWSPKGILLAASSETDVLLCDTRSGSTISLSDSQGGRLSTSTWSPASAVERDHFSVPVWSPDGAMLAAKAIDGGVRLWSQQESLLLECHAANEAVGAVQWSPGGTLLAASGYDSPDNASIVLFRTGTWERLAVIPNLCCAEHIAWHPQFPNRPLLATAGKRRDTISVWSLDGSEDFL